MPRVKSKPRRITTSIPRAAFARLVREIADDRKSDLLWQPGALRALQESAETMLDHRFGRARELAGLCKVDTITLGHFRGAAETKT
jgi:histone H3/H4